MNRPPNLSTIISYPTALGNFVLEVGKSQLVIISRNERREMLLVLRENAICEWMKTENFRRVHIESVLSGLKNKSRKAFTRSLRIKLQKLTLASILEETHSLCRNTSKFALFP